MGRVKSLLLLIALYAGSMALVAVSPLPVLPTMLLAVPVLWLVADLVQP